MDTDRILSQLAEGAILEGPHWSEPVKVLTAKARGSRVEVQAVGTHTKKLWTKLLRAEEFSEAIRITQAGQLAALDGNPTHFRLAAEAHRIRLAFQYDPHFAVSVSQVDPLPHQMDAVYTHLLTQGYRTLNHAPRKDLHQEVDTPAGHAAFHDEALLVGMLLDERQGQAAKPSQVLGQAAGSHAAGVSIDEVSGNTMQTRHATRQAAQTAEHWETTQTLLTHLSWGHGGAWKTLALPVVLVLACAGTASAAQEQALVRNGGFEEVRDGRPTGWYCGPGVGPVTPARSGKWAVKVHRHVGVVLWRPFALEPGYLYQASVWARGRGPLFIRFREYKTRPRLSHGRCRATGTRGLRLSDRWQQFHFSYSRGPNEADVKGLTLEVATHHPKAEAVIDDVSLTKTPMPAQPENILNNPRLLVRDGDRVPDGWHAEKRRVQLDNAPGGIPCVRLAGRFFSEDYQPDAQFRNWWSWARWGRTHVPALPYPMGGELTVLLRSDPVPVTPCCRYDVNVLMREHEVWGDFVGVRWLNAAKKPISVWPERIGGVTNGCYHWHSDMLVGYSGDWVRYVGRTTAPQVARYATLVVGACLGSGSLWVAQPRLSIARGAPYRHKPRAERLPADITQGVPRPTRTTPKPFPAPPPAKPGVHVGPTQIRVTFANGVSVELPLRGKRLVGIGTVRCARTLLRSPQAPPLAPVVQTNPTRSWSACVYEGWEKTKGGIVIRSTLRSTGGERDRLDWILAPASRRLAGRAYAGLSYGYRFTSDTLRVMRIRDRATWELGGHAIGTRVARWAALLEPLRRPSLFCCECDYRFVGADVFDYQTSPAGTLVSFLDRHQTTFLFRAATPDFIVAEDTFLFPEVGDAATATKHVLFCPEPGGPDDWTAVRDEVIAHYRHRLGAPPETPLEPGALILGYGKAHGIGSLRWNHPSKWSWETIYQNRPTYYRWVADKAVPRLAQLGFKRVMIIGPMSPWNRPERDMDTLRPEYEAPFKHVCDMARKHGMGVISWYATGFNRDGSWVWDTHPDFVLPGPDGKRARAYYSPGMWPGNLASGYGQFTLDRIADAKRRTGLAGLWLDSYSNSTHLLRTRSFRDTVRQADALLPWQARIEMHGLYTYGEGLPTCLGTLSTGCWRPPPDPALFRPEHYYKQGLYMQQWPGTEFRAFLSDPDRRPYYRWLANRCCPLLDVGILEEDLAAIDLIAQANRDFNAVSDRMQVRKLLGNRGVQWSSGAGGAVFVFEPLSYVVPKGMDVHDVTAGKPIAVPANRRVDLERYHTYRLTRR